MKLPSPPPCFYDFIRGLRNYLEILPWGDTRAFHCPAPLHPRTGGTQTQTCMQSFQKNLMRVFDDEKPPMLSILQILLILMIT
jgi:hypothetical protein